MGVINGGSYLNIMYLYFDAKTLKVVNSAIEGPVPVCERIFTNAKNCEYKDEKALETAG